MLLQDRNDLLFRLPLALHRLVLSQGQTPIHLGSIQWGNVTADHQQNAGNYCALHSTPRSAVTILLDS
jgi:hypothetical protein